MNNQRIAANSSSPHRDDLLLEIEQIPEKYLPELLQFVRLFRQTITIQTSLTDWEKGINEINSSDSVKQQRKSNIQKLFDSWNELDEQQEQQETLEILESMKGISI
jgi:predicted Zn-dependent protease